MMKKILEIKSERTKFSAPRKLQNNFLDPENQQIFLDLGEILS
jgi:hypothetical protein